MRSWAFCGFKDAFWTILESEDIFQNTGQGHFCEVRTFMESNDICGKLEHF